MSSPEIRAAARAMVAHASWPAGLPYFETHSTEPDKATIEALSTWCSLQFEAFSDERIGIGPGAPRRELGVVRIVILGKSGLGEDALMSAVLSIRALPATWSAWPAGTYIVSVSPPISVDPGAEGNWLRVDLEVRYSRDHT